jgi:hypothetical protein
MLDPQKRNRSRVERDLLLQKLESETSKKKIAELKKGLSPLVNPARGRRGYEINAAEEELARRLDGRSLFFECFLAGCPNFGVQPNYFHNSIASFCELLLSGI